MANVYVELAEVFVAGPENNSIQCSVGYHKNKGAVVLSMIPCKVMPAKEGEKFSSVAIGVMQAPSESVVIEGGWKRANFKKALAIENRICDEIKQRKEQGWDIVTAFAAKHGLKIK